MMQLTFKNLYFQKPWTLHNAVTSFVCKLLSHKSNLTLQGYLERENANIMLTIYTMKFNVLSHEIKHMCKLCTRHS